MTKQPLAIFACLTFLLGAGLSAQESTDSQSTDSRSDGTQSADTPGDDAPFFFEQVDVLVVNVDVVVQREDGRPSTNLRAGDFEILEDGQPVDITNFIVVQGRQGTFQEGATVVDPNLDPTAPRPETRGLSLVIFVDNLNLRPENRNLILDNLKEFVDTSFDVRDRYMIVSMGDTVEVVQKFTNDRDDLMAAIGSLEKSVGFAQRFDAQHRIFLSRLERAPLAPSPPPNALSTSDFDAAVSTAESLASEARFLAEQRYQQVRGTIDALGQFTASLSGMRGRKALLYVSDGIPIRPADSLSRSWTNKYDNWILQENVGELTSRSNEIRRFEGGSEYDATSMFNELVDTAAANRVVFYPISLPSRTIGNRVSAEFNASTQTNGLGPRSSDVVAVESQSLDASLMLLAGGTGGRAFTRTANIGSLMENIVQDFDIFYSLGYSPDHGRDGEFHEVEVRVKRPGFKIRYMKGYREKDPVSHLQDLTMSAMHYDLDDNRLEVRLEPQVEEPREEDRFLVPVLVKIPFRNLLLVPQQDFHTSQVSLYVVVRDEKTGGVSPFQRIDLPIKIPNSAMLQALTQVAGYPLELNMKKGPKRISIGVRDHVANTYATINLDVDVGGG